jgi:hypothetical protein
MLIIPESQFLAELAAEKSRSQTIAEKASKNYIEVEEVVMENTTYNTFRKVPGEKNIPEEVKSVIGALAETHTREELSEQFNISKDTVGDLALDKHSNSRVSEAKVNIIEKCKDITLNKLAKSLEFLEITREMKPREQVAIAESLSRIHEKLTPKEAATPLEAKFIFYTPDRQNDIKDYEVIDAVT